MRRNRCRHPAVQLAGAGPREAPDLYWAKRVLHHAFLGPDRLDRPELDESDLHCLFASVRDEIRDFSRQVMSSEFGR